MRLEQALSTAAGQLLEAGVATPRLDAEILMAYVFGVEREDLLTCWDQNLDETQTNQFKNLINKRSGREPVARITGVQEFWSLAFKVVPETLIPRPDSETLVSVVLDKFNSSSEVSILDLGTGTGCLLLSLLSELPKANGMGVDISQEAVECAAENAKNLRMSDRAVFKRYNWMKNKPLNQGAFDIVISNPPYIPTGEIAGLEPEVATFAPGAALQGGRDGLDHYRHIIQRLPNLLSNKNSFIALEVGEGQAREVEVLLKQAGFGGLKTHPDLAGIERVLTAIR